MKKKLIAAMLLLSIQVNGAEKNQKVENFDNFCQFPMEIESTDCSKNDRINRLEKFYQSESLSKPPLQILGDVFGKNVRKTFFEVLLQENSNLTNDGVLLQFIKAATREIINSPEYMAELSDSEDGSFEDSPGYIYRAPPLFSLIEALDPIARQYMRKVKIS